MGCFADLGWAWNVKPSRTEVAQWKSRIPSGEFVESFVIFLYGISNVWLEHLAAWGGEWIAQDLEHVSISILFLGGGLVSHLLLGKYQQSADLFLVWHACRVDHDSKFIECDRLQSADAASSYRRRLAKTEAAKDLQDLNEPNARSSYPFAWSHDELSPSE